MNNHPKIRSRIKNKKYFRYQNKLFCFPLWEGVLLHTFSHHLIHDLPPPTALTPLHCSQKKTSLWKQADICMCMCMYVYVCGPIRCFNEMTRVVFRLATFLLEILLGSPLWVSAVIKSYHKNLRKHYTCWLRFLCKD